MATIGFADILLKRLAGQSFNSRIEIRDMRAKVLLSERVVSVSRVTGRITGAVVMAAKKATKKSAGIRKKKTSSRKTLPAEAVADPSSGNRAASSTRWTFLTNHTHVLVLLDTDEPPVLREVATRVGITERAVQRIIQDLEGGGFIERERVGRRNRYRVLHDQELRHPIESHRTIGDLLNLVNEDA